MNGPADLERDYATAEEILHNALTRLRRERDEQAEEVVSCQDQLAYAVEMYRQAVVAAEALEALLASPEFVSGQTASPAVPLVVAAPAPQAPVETVNWRLARSPGEPIASALDDQADAVVIEAPEPPAQPEPIIEPICQPEPISRFARTTARPLTIPQIIAGKIMDAAPALFAAHPAGVPITAIMAEIGVAYNQTTVALTQLHKAGKVAWIKAANDHKHKLMLPAGTPAPVLALTANQEKVLDALSAAAVDGVATITRGDIHRLTGVAHGSLPQITDSLALKGYIRPDAGAGRAATSYRVLKPSRAPGAETVKAGAKYSNPIPGPVPAVLMAPERPKESVLWEKAEPVTRTRPARALAATDCPAVPAAAPSPVQPLVVPVEFDDADMPAWWPPGSLLALKYGDCRWPTNTPPPGRGEETKFCCKPAIEGASYCPDHVDAAHGRAVRA